jgi:TolB-like protein
MKEVMEYCELFSNETINRQLEKVLVSPDFATSDILSRFLIYIVNETLSGRSTNIKEYNIGVDVLQKPLHFKPNSNGVVRVHARRLRIALENYYNIHGKEDDCFISIPKGRYVPSFEKLKHETSKKSVNSCILPKHIRLAVLPFHCFDEDNIKLSFAENIVLMLNTKFGVLRHLSVLSYFTVQQFKIQKSSIKKLASQYGLQYIVTGAVQFESSRLRLIVQLIDGTNENQIWSNVYNLKSANSDFFNLEDKAVLKIMNDLEQFNEIFNQPIITEGSKRSIEKPEEKKVYFLNKYVKNEKSSRKTV